MANGRVQTAWQALLVALALVGFPALGLFYALTGRASGWQSIAYRVLYLVIAFGAFLWFAKGQKTYLWRVPAGKLLILYFLLASARLFWDLLANPGYFMGRGDRTLTWFLVVVTLPLVGFLVPLRAGSGRMVLKTCLIFLLVVSIGWLVFGFYINPAKAFYTRRFQTDEFNAISMGQMGGTLLLLSLYAQFNKIFRRTSLTILGMVLGSVILVLATSRGPLLAVVGCVMAMLFVKIRSKGARTGRILVWTVLSLVLLFLALQWANENTPLRLLTRLTEDTNAYEESSWYRLVVMREAMRVFYANPIFGAASLIPSLHDYPHNLFIESLMAVGLVGTGVLLMALVSGTVKSFRMLGSGHEYGFLAILFWENWIEAMVSGSVYSASGPEWHFLAAILVLGSLRSDPGQAQAPDGGGDLRPGPVDDAAGSVGMANGGPVI